MLAGGLAEQRLCIDHLYHMAISTYGESSCVAELNDVACRLSSPGRRVRCAVEPGKGRALLSGATFQPGDIIFHEPPCHVVSIDRGNPAYTVVSKLCDGSSTGEALEPEPEPAPEPALQGAASPAAAALAAELVQLEALPPPLWALWCALNSLTRDDIDTVDTVDAVPGRSALAANLTCVSRETQRKLLCLCHGEVATPGRVVCAALSELGLAAFSDTSSMHADVAAAAAAAAAVAAESKIRGPAADTSMSMSLQLGQGDRQRQHHDRCCIDLGRKVEQLAQVFAYNSFFSSSGGGSGSSSSSSSSDSSSSSSDSSSSSERYVVRRACSTLTVPLLSVRNP